jgi:hemolysin III
MTDQSIEWQKYNTSLADGGAKYSETNIANYIVEPWNAVSSLIFLIPAIYWAICIRKTIKENLFLAYCIPLLVAGGLGSTLFHAFRTSPFLLILDVLPIMILTLSVSGFFWFKLTQNRWITLAIVFFAFVLRRLVVDTEIFSNHTGANISYFISGATIFIPVLIVLVRTGFYKASSIILSILMFILALFFREMDAWENPFLPMGTHFLWHLFSAIGAYLIAKYVYTTSKIPASIGEVAKAYVEKEAA